MTGRVLPFDAATHAAADALLPFYVNATLQGEELALVQHHVQGCERCLREVERLRHIFEASTAFALLQGERLGQPSPMRAKDPPLYRREGTARIQAIFGTPRLRRWTPWLLAAQLAAIVLLGSLLATDSRDFASYRTLGIANPAVVAADTIAVIFDPAIAESEMRRVVVGIGARIVDGPTTTDVFVLAIPTGFTEQALRALRSERAVRFAESLGPRTGR